jgi:hypothetical protein
VKTILARLDPFAPLVVFVLALALRWLSIAANRFDGLYGQDAYAYFGYAREFVTALTQARLPPPFHWPLGYPALLASAFVLFGQSIATAQWVTMVCGAAAAGVTVLLARVCAPAEYSGAAGWVAGLVIACGGQAVQSSVVIMADAPALLWSALSAWLLIRFFATRRVLTLALASLALGLTILTRWQMLAFALAWFAALVTFFVLERKARRFLLLMLALTIVVLVLAPQLYYERLKAEPVAGASWVTGWSPANFIARSFDTVDGHFDYALPVAVFYAQPLFHPAYLFPLLTPFAIFGAYLLFRRGRPAAPISVLLLGSIGITFLFLAGIPYENFRFGLGMFVPAAVLTGLGAGWLWQKFLVRRAIRLVLAGVIAISLAGMIFWQPRVLRPILDAKANDLARTQWLASRIPRESAVYTFGINGALETYGGIRAQDAWNVTLDEMKARAVSMPTFLYLDIENVTSQWRGFRVEQNWRALHEQGRLRVVGELLGWTLYQIV